MNTKGPFLLLRQGFFVGANGQCDIGDSMDRIFRMIVDPSIEITEFYDEKVAIEFVDRDNRIRGTAALLFLKRGYAKSLGQGRYIISDYLQEYLEKKGVEFRLIPLPPKLRSE